MGGDITVDEQAGRGLDVHDPPAADRAERRSARDRGGVRSLRVGSRCRDEEPLILVVDDDATVRELVERHLERAGFAVVTARGGQEGLRLVRELRPAAVTLDIMMPDLDGWTVLAAIKGDPALASIPVVLMSIVDEKNRGYALGGGRLPGQAGRPRQAGGDADRHLRPGRGPRPSGRRRRGGPPRRAPGAGADRMAGDRGGERPGRGRIAHRRAARRDHSRPDDAEDGRVRVPRRAARDGRTGRTSRSW